MMNKVDCLEKMIKTTKAQLRKLMKINKIGKTREKREEMTDKITMMRKTKIRVPNRLNRDLFQRDSSRLLTGFLEMWIRSSQ